MTSRNKWILAGLAIFVLFNILSIITAGVPSNGGRIDLDDLESMEVYQVLENGIGEDSTLQEMFDVFIEMCCNPMETTRDIYIFEIYSYEYEGQQYIHCLITRQFEIPSYYEFLDCGFSATYLLDEDIAGLKDSTRMEGDLDAFIEYVLNSPAFQSLLTKPIYQRNIGIDSW